VLQFSVLFLYLKRRPLCAKRARGGSAAAAAVAGDAPRMGRSTDAAKDTVRSRARGRSADATGDAARRDRSTNATVDTARSVAKRGSADSASGGPTHLRPAAKCARGRSTAAAEDATHLRSAAKRAECLDLSSLQSFGLSKDFPPMARFDRESFARRTRSSMFLSWDISEQDPIQLLKGLNEGLCIQLMDWSIEDSDPYLIAKSSIAVDKELGIRNGYYIGVVCRHTAEGL
jgi:hypothetical protein